MSRQDWAAHALIGEAIAERTEAHANSLFDQHNAKALLLIGEAGKLLAESSEGSACRKALTLSVRCTINLQGNKEAKEKGYRQCREVVTLTTNLLGGKHPMVNYVKVDLVRRLFRYGASDQAEEFVRAGIESAREAYGRQPRTAGALYILGSQLLNRKRKLVEAEQILRESVEIYSETIGALSPRTLVVLRLHVESLSAVCTQVE